MPDEPERRERRDRDAGERKLEEQDDAEDGARAGERAPEPEPRGERGDRERREHRETGLVPADRERERIDERAGEDGRARRAQLAQEQADRQAGEREPEAVEQERAAPVPEPERGGVGVEEQRILRLDDVAVEVIAVEEPRGDAHVHALVAGDGGVAAHENEREAEEQRARPHGDPARAHRAHDRASFGYGFDRRLSTASRRWRSIPST